MSRTLRFLRGVSFRAKTGSLLVYNNAVKERTMKKELFDCMITCGELDPEWYGHYKKDTVIREVVKHNVTQEEALAWHGSAECMKRVQEFEDIGRKKFGEDHWMKWGVSYFWTTAHD